MATFEVGVETAKVEITSTRVLITMLPRTWQRVWEGPDLADDGHVRTRSLRRLLATQEILEQNQNVLLKHERERNERERNERESEPVLPRSNTLRSNTLRDTPRSKTTSASASPLALDSSGVASAAR